jgi:hypothetical protein
MKAHPNPQRGVASPHLINQTGLAINAAFRAAGALKNPAHTPSPRCLNTKPPDFSITEDNTSSWRANIARISTASASHSELDDSISVNKNVTVPKEEQARQSLAHHPTPPGNDAHDALKPAVNLSVLPV